jgi:hypothetical protein
MLFEDAIVNRHAELLLRRGPTLPLLAMPWESQSEGSKSFAVFADRAGLLLASASARG